MNIEIKDKYSLTIKEAAKYFNIGEKKLYSIVSENDTLAIRKGRQYLIIRERFEEFLLNTSSI